MWGGCGEEGERVPLRTLTHVLKLCRPDSIGLAQLQVKSLRARINATTLGAEMVEGTRHQGSTTKGANASYSARSRTP
jgi:hypothetical protein